MSVSIFQAWKHEPWFVLASVVGSADAAFYPFRGTGAWDMFHAGHMAILKQAREYGDYLIAGVHSDEVVNAQRGFNMPIMNLNERVLSVLGCAYVNDVLIDAPLRITRFVTFLHILQDFKKGFTCLHWGS